MTIPAFTDKGILPEGIHQCTLEEAKERFATSEHRSALWHQLIQVIGIMRKHGLAGILFIDGSYVTDKAMPGDIEIVLDVRTESAEKIGKAAIFFAKCHDRLKTNFGIDWYPNYPGGNDFTVFFQYTRPTERTPSGTKKGILRIESWN